LPEKKPRVSIIIPSLDGYREGRLPKLLKELSQQTYQDFEVQVIKGDPRQGRAINRGVRKSSGSILVIMDDDVSLGHNRVLENLVKAVEEDPRIGMAGASLSLPPEASWFHRRVIAELPRYTFPVVDKVVDSDFASHPCCAIPRHVFEEIGGEREEIIRGLDPDLRVRIRQAGYRVVLVPNTWIYHWPPKTFFGLLKKFFRNGMGSAYAQIVHPELVYETWEKLDMQKFVEKRPFLYRLFRFPLRLIHSIATFKIFRFLSYVSYGLGFIWGWVKTKRKR